MKPSDLLLCCLAIYLSSTTEGLRQELQSMQCNKKLTFIRQTACTSCAASSRMQCPKGWLKATVGIGHRNCRYEVALAENILSLSGGCYHLCKREIEEKHCCDGHWGSRCYECPGGYKTPCSGHGTCLDGITRNGTCICEEKYGGYACQDCKNDSLFGPDCQSVCECQHGICNHGVAGDGSCTCYGGYTGPKCDQELPLCQSVPCEHNTHCMLKDGKAICDCLPGYKKIGNSCQVQGGCSESPCSPFATCKALEQSKFECTCNDGYQGDGRTCQPIDPCVENNGGCPENSTVCEFIIPGKAICKCKPGLSTSNIALGCSFVNECRQYFCDRTSECKVDATGSPSCVCKSDEVGDGRSCYKTLLREISTLTIRGRLGRSKTNTKQVFELGCSLLLEKYGPFTVFVPSLFPVTDQLLNNVTIAENLCKMYIIPGQYLIEDLIKIKTLWTLSGHKVIFNMYNRHYRYSDIPEPVTFSQANLPAANGIIHIVSSLRKIPTFDNLGNSQKTIGEILASLDICSRFKTILENCGLPSILDGPGPFTVFIPSNEAVDELRDGRLIYLFTEGIKKLQELVKHHIYTAAGVKVERLIMMPHILTMANQILKINVTNDGRILLGDSAVALNKRNIVASNGVIHTLDGIVIPPSIIPILPHKCSEQQYKVVKGSCVDCDALNTSVCPPQSTVMEETGLYRGECVYTYDPLGLNILKKGCTRFCNQTVWTQGCCKGFFGPDCNPCPGGFTNSCYGKGNCSDGLQGNGQCRCFEAFTGIACHICSNPNKHGENCDEDCACIHGVCDNRPGSKGVCHAHSCKDGYTGELCDRRSQNCGPAGASLNCHQNAICSLNDTARCVCVDGYEGDGFACEPIDVCSKPERGGCSENAVCTRTGPGTGMCQCNKGWTGDGEACIAINNCATETRGGCHIDAVCHYDGPGQSSCICKTGYVGDGYNCDSINSCLVNNGGCHVLAICRSLGAGERTCNCSDGYVGDGFICYGELIKELARNYHFSSFYDWIQKSMFSIPKGANHVTVLVPLTAAIQNLSQAEKDFWLTPNMLPFLVRAHFLQGSFMTEQLKKYVGQEIPTLNPRTRWKISNNNGTITIQNASIILDDIPAINSTIHIINKQYQLIGEIESSDKYTIFVPSNRSIEKYCDASNITQLENDTVQYHVILGEKLFSTDLKSGVHKRTMLGFSYWLIFYKNGTQAFVNKVLLNGQFVETRNGMLIGVSQVLQVQKNRCTTNTTSIEKSKCAKCNRGIKCSSGSVLAVAPGKGYLPRCEYGIGRRKAVGCYFTCVQVSLVSICCPGYYGHMCEMCPGIPGNWCSGNGVCQDGITGSGECQCNEGFHGTACEMCQPGRYGASCKSECSCKNGTCQDGLLGDGSCRCDPGWMGDSCDKKIGTNFCNSTCDVNANCINGSATSQPTCLCSAGYTGNGTYCAEIDPCKLDHGGCSRYANCTKVAPGQRTCTCEDGYAGDGTVCREINRCLDNNGGCHRNAECVKTGPNQVACNCLPDFRGDGVINCEPVNPCEKNNGGCSPLASCFVSISGTVRCVCMVGVGDGFTCRRSIQMELAANEDASIFFKMLQVFEIPELTGSGPFTVFVPHNGIQWNSSTLSEWKSRGFLKDLLRYHMVSCHLLRSDDLELYDSLTALSGHNIRVSMKENRVYLNEEVRITATDFIGTNGVLHFIDQLLIPYDVQHHNISSNLSQKTITEVAETYGYLTFSKLLKEAGLLPLVNNIVHQPFTMLWPTDAAFNALPMAMQKELYHKDHRDKLAAYLKGHIIRITKVSASRMSDTSPLRTIHGSFLSFSCSKTSVGDLLVDNGNARIVQRYMEFDVGIAYGIDHLLEPPDLGSRCDDFQTAKLLDNPCGVCDSPPPCPHGSFEQGKSRSCIYLAYSSLGRPSRFIGFGPWSSRERSRTAWKSRSVIPGCARSCFGTKRIPQCCKNHYGKDCHVCPGGLEAPCSNHGTCDDMQEGSGRCNCTEAFIGASCEHCAPGRYGSECKECKCTENGMCNEGLYGDGFCFCSEGWTGERCETPLAVMPKCSPPCHAHAVCRFNNTCECNLHYEGDGWTCTVIDQCGNDNGGCSDHAKCTQVGTDVSCNCLPDYEGSGFICSPIDRCADGRNGGCSEHASCFSTGPNMRRCECKVGYVGNGVQCLEEAIPPIDRCLEENGQCHPEAICTDLHFHDKTAGVFHLQSPKGKYNFTYQDAEASCIAEGATLATIQQLSAAQQMGFHLCLVGWLSNQTAGYPTVYSNMNCGTNHVGIVNYGIRSNLSERWDAYCYGAKDVWCGCRDGFVGNGYTCSGSLLAVLAQHAKFSIYYSMLLDSANATQEGQEFLDLLSSDVTRKTLFAPLNSGFGDNTTLTLNDLKLHVSLSDVILLSINLTAGTIIPSQAGYNLTIAESVNTTGSKVVNDTVIVEWDILASNGIIHAIEMPLTVPFQQGHPNQGAAIKSSTAMTTGVSIAVALVLLCVAIAGGFYYYLKRTNQRFQFRYFKAELDDEEPSSWEERSPTLVSIPNPIYGAHTSIYEPFEDSVQDDF